MTWVQYRNRSKQSVDHGNLKISREGATFRSMWEINTDGPIRHPHVLWQRTREQALSRFCTALVATYHETEVTGLSTATMEKHRSDTKSQEYNGSVQQVAGTGQRSESIIPGKLFRKQQ